MKVTPVRSMVKTGLRRLETVLCQHVSSSSSHGTATRPSSCSTTAPGESWTVIRSIVHVLAGQLPLVAFVRSNDRSNRALLIGPPHKRRNNKDLGLAEAGSPIAETASARSRSPTDGHGRWRAGITQAG